ncbi:hypothetical protein AVEN_98733-1 [Araneus ventricosus]|uniref:Uncharacterized protein n=1 Tax=Araneus ventricosus TaxID=182803 RepID=A0A4Y2TLJ9_ARAVE|nr:hypothetical protein AVEN_98733-1 [Araneus ventricosus]
MSPHVAARSIVRAADAAAGPEPSGRVTLDRHPRHQSYVSPPYRLRLAPLTSRVLFHHRGISPHRQYPDYQMGLYLAADPGTISCVISPDPYHGTDRVLLTGCCCAVSRQRVRQRQSACPRRIVSAQIHRTGLRLTRLIRNHLVSPSYGPNPHPPKTASLHHWLLLRRRYHSAAGSPASTVSSPYQTTGSVRVRTRGG